MRHHDQITQARKLLSYLDTRTTALADSIYCKPVSDYTCPQQAALEREVFFRCAPINIGLGCLLPNPGDWMTHDYTGVPILFGAATRRVAERRPECVSAPRSACREGQRQRRQQLLLPLSRLDLWPRRETDSSTGRALLRDA